MDELSTLDATAQAELVRSGQASPRELVDAAIERIERVNPQLNAVIHERFDKARAEADGPLADGPFRGVPFVLKDLDGFSDGDPCHMGTRYLKDRNYISDHDSWLTEQFRQAGLICVGRANTPELGLIPSTEPAVYGPTHNPWDPTRTAGGSSGGSAASVAAGLVPVAHAGDGGGSIRIPASACGLVGLKPTRGRTSMGPEAGDVWGGFVVRFAVTRTVRDCASLLDAVAGTMPGDPNTAPPPMRPFAKELDTDPGQLRIGWRADAPTTQVTPEAVAAVENTARLLESLGHHVEQASPAALDEPEMEGHFITCFGAFTARTLDGLSELAGEPLAEDGFEPGTWMVAEMGRDVTAVQYLAAMDWLQGYSRRVANWWAGGYDLLLTPTLPEPAPTLGQFGPTPDNPLNGLMRSAAFVPFCAPFNVTGQPAISVPIHADPASGLPIGVQLVAAMGREDLLIRVASQLEVAAPWAGRRPTIHA